MNQIQMFRQTMAAFKADPEWPTSHLITESLPETPALGDKKAPWRAINDDVFAVMSAYNQNAGVMNFASPTNPGGGVEYGAKAQEEVLPEARIWSQHCGNLNPVITRQTVRMLMVG